MTCTISCSTPPAMTPAAKAQMGSSNVGARKSVAAMKERLRSTGVKAGTAKCLRVLRTEAANATRLMNAM